MMGDYWRDNAITQEDLVDAYKKYLKSLDYSDFEVEIISADLNSPYSAPYIVQEYDETINLDDTKYAVYACKTDFRICGIFRFENREPFSFYMLVDTRDIPNKKVGEYMSARKKYVLIE